jgi:hypothetical protein
MRLRTKKALFAGKARIFFAENRRQNPQERGRRGLFSFGEMSDVKALARPVKRCYFYRNFRVLD